MRSRLFFMALLFVCGCERDEQAFMRDYYRRCLGDHFDTCVESIAPAMLASTTLSGMHPPDVMQCLEASKQLCALSYPSVAVGD